MTIIKKKKKLLEGTHDVQRKEAHKLIFALAEER